MSAPVVVLHGLGRSRLAMLPLVRALHGAGWRPLNVGYFAARRPVTAIAAGVAERLDRLLAHEDPQVPIHFVTHSLGGILARSYLARAARPGARLVQLAPPNQGAHLAERLHRIPLLGAVPGRTLRDLGVEEGGPRLRLDPLAGVEVGVIAGGRGQERGYGPWLPDDNDGIVRVSETWLAEARDWILLPELHTFIMRSPRVHAHVLAFLREGRFLPDAPRLRRDPASGALACELPPACSPPDEG